MQLCAQNSQKNIVYAQNANKHEDYFCLECSQVVRVRQGTYRQPHFYHRTAVRSCYQNGKSEEHIHIQMHVKKLFPDEDCSLEYRFVEINRIADVVVWSKKLIFEVQCSFITADEIKERNRHYESIGFTVIWILHDKRYNKEKPASPEYFLESMPHYFSNMNCEGKGMIYDQFSFISNQKRIKLTEPFSIDLRQKFFVEKGMQIKKSIPKVIESRLKTWGLYFQGDLLSLYFENNDERISRIYELEKAFIRKKSSPVMAFLRKWLLRPYHLLFQILLEKACR